MRDNDSALADLTAAINAEDTKLAQTLVILTAIPNLLMQAKGAPDISAALEQIAIHVQNQTALIQAGNLASGESGAATGGGVGTGQLTLTGGALATGATVGESYTDSKTLAGAVSGGEGPYTFEATETNGLNVGADGTVSGTPEDAEDTSISVEVTDSSETPNTATATFTLSVAPAEEETLALETTSLADGVVGQTYTGSLSATGGKAPYLFNTTPTLVNGVQFQTDGSYAGSPVAAESDTVDVVVTDSSEPPQTASGTFTLVVEAVPATPGGATGSTGSGTAPSTTGTAAKPGATTANPDTSTVK